MKYFLALILIQFSLYADVFNWQISPVVGYPFINNHKLKTLNFTDDWFHWFITDIDCKYMFLEMFCDGEIPWKINRNGQSVEITWDTIGNEYL